MLLDKSLLRTLRWKVLSSSTKTWSRGSWTPSTKTKNGVAFFTGSFLITNSLNIQTYLWIYLPKRDYAALQTYFLLLALFCSIRTKYTTLSHFPGRFWSFEITIFQAYICYYCHRHLGVFRTYSNIWDGAFVESC